MTKVTVLSGALPAALTILFVGSVAAQEKKPCKIEILSPTKGDKVGTNGQIRGTVASIPPGMFLWVAVHKEGLSKWWPQGGGAVKPKSDGTWVVAAVYGDEADPKKDAGANFEITAVVVDEQGDKDLASYVRTSEKENHYPGTDLPAIPSGGCSLKDDVVVERR